MNYLYARTSTKDQENGLEDQKKRLLEWASTRGTYQLLEEQASAKSVAHRPILVETMAKLDAEGGTLVVTALTRLTRSTLDFYNIVSRAERMDWSIVVLEMDLDTGTATGRLIAGVLVQVGEWERAVISERTRNGLREAALKRNPDAELLNPTPDFERRLRSLHKEGLSYRAIAKQLNDEGVPTPAGEGEWYHVTVRRIVSPDRKRVADA